MVTGELKNRIDGLWDIFAAGGLVNPLEVIEQITYLMFIHDLDDSDNLRAREAAMLDLVENASSKKSKSENFITKFARYYTPIVVIIAVILAIVPPLIIKNAEFSVWLYRGEVNKVRFICRDIS